MERKKVAILGATGSIGKSAAAVIRQNPGQYQVAAISAHEDYIGAIRLAKEFSVPFVAMTGLGELPEEAPAGVSVGLGPQALMEACDRADIVVLAVVGIAGLPVFKYCLKKGVDIALANKEALVCGGRLARQLMDSSTAKTLPVDSESYAIFQCVHGRKDEDVRKILLTASGGPFRTWPREKFSQITVEQALRHPNWSMGKKITIDSATLVNKGLEMIENSWLFGVAPENIQIVVHRESVIHSMVEFRDNSVMAQLAAPDMRLAISGALAYPNMTDTGVAQLDLFALGSLHFEQPDFDKFPALRMAYEAMSQGQASVIAYNTANEVAVDRFLKGKIGFLDIWRTIAGAMARFSREEIGSFSDIYELDGEVRRFLRE